MATLLVHPGAAGMLLMLQECYRYGSEAFQKSCGDTVVVVLLQYTYDRCLLLLGAKQGQDMYLAGQLLPSLLQQCIPCTEQRSCDHVVVLAGPRVY